MLKEPFASRNLDNLGNQMLLTCGTVLNSIIPLTSTWNPVTFEDAVMAWAKSLSPPHTTAEMKIKADNYKDKVPRKNGIARDGDVSP